ncbi:DUF7289 family protein [Halomontanus rarus]|uniref:DUF7289 family protein n=1 Tax=Halomontanus rarus TaxID=3034020 RepID=UPI001A98F2C0
MTGIGPRVRRGDGNGDRAVSEVIAFVLVFSIIIGSVGILYMTGFQSMTDFQEGEQMRNAERAMSALGENLNDVQRNRGIEERSGELSLRGGTVSSTDDGTTLEISVDDTSGTSVFDENVELGSITYQQDSSLIAYEGGGVFRGVEGEPSQSVVIDRPRLTCTDTAAVISVVKISGGGDERSIGGEDNVEVTVMESETRVETFSDADRVEIDVGGTPAYENGWDTVLSENGWDSTGTCDSISTATVRIVEVEVDF